jgi:hypothetical protein
MGCMLFNVLYNDTMRTSLMMKNTLKNLRGLEYTDINYEGRPESKDRF